MKIRDLTQIEREAIAPEVRAYLKGQEAANRLQRMAILLSGGDPSVELDIGNMALVRREPEQIELGV